MFNNDPLIHLYLLGKPNSNTDKDTSMKKILGFLSVLIIGMKTQGQVQGTFAQGFHGEQATNTLNWTQPVGATFSKSGQLLFVWEKRGHLYVCKRQGSGAQVNYNKQITAVIDIEHEVGNWEDYGLLGFALDPEFNDNGGYIYLMYCVDRHHLLTGGLAANGYNPGTNEYNNATIGRITRYNTSIVEGKLVADPASRIILLGATKTTGIPLLHNSHSVGSLAFAADGTLLVSVGDGASWEQADAGYYSRDAVPSPNTFRVTALADGIIRDNEDVGAFRSQMLNSYSGKILRINRANGQGLDSNPFWDPNAPNSPQSKVWALGFRNPFRMSIKPGSGSTNPSAGDIGELFVGDVGLGQWEELNVVKAPGTNFGWPLYEGSTPSFEPNKGYWGWAARNYDETYNTISNPAQLMLFKALIAQDNAAGIGNIYDPVNGAVIASGIRYLHARPALEWARNPGSTRVSRYDAQGNAIWPTLGSPASNASGSTFTGNASTGGIWYRGATNNFPPGYQNTFLVADYGGQWIRKVGIDFTDVVTSVEPLVTNAGYVVCLAENPIDGSVVYITIENPVLVPAGLSRVNKIVYGGNIPPVAKITLPENVNNYTPNATLTLNLKGSESFDPTPGGSLSTYEWDFGDNTTSTAQNPVHTFSTADNAPKMFVVKLTVTDNQGADAEDEFIVSLKNTPPNVNIISPANNLKYTVGADTTYQLLANVTDNEQERPGLAYAWQTTLVHNNHTHPGAIDTAAQTTAHIKRYGCTQDTYHWHIKLTVTDEAGLSTSAVSQIYPAGCDGPLPLVLHKFSVTQNASVNMVKWTTELESHIEYFEVERSSDGVNFEPINKQDARNSTGTSHYSYGDRDFPPGYNYYRLKIVEVGSTIRYSVIVRTESEAENLKLKIVPNPVSGNFSVIYKSFEDDKVTIQIMDITGRVLHTLKENVNRGQNVIYLQNLPNWPAGVYFLSVQNKDEVKREKFVKTR